jgi:mannosyltransferase
MGWSPHKRAVLIVVVGGLFLFLWGSGQAYRSDEVWSLRTVALPYAEMMEEIRNDIHPPLYYWMLAAWTRAFGSGEAAARLLSILMCLAAAGVMYAAGKEGHSPRAGLLASVLFLTSPLTGLAAQFVRMYALLGLVSAVSMLGFLRLSRREKVRTADWAIYIAANIAGSFTHVWFFFLLFAQGIAHAAISRTGRIVRMTLMMALSLAPYAILWLPTLLRQIRRSEAALAWAPRPGVVDLAETAAFLGGIFLLAAPFLWPWRKNVSTIILQPALVALLTIAVPFAISFWKPLFWPRFTIVALPAFCLTVAGFAPSTSRYRLEAGIMGASCALALILSFYASKCDSRSAAEYLARNTRDGDVVVYTSLSRMPIDYYWDRIQAQRQVSERSFPAETDSHPGFEGAIHTAAPAARLKTEAAALTRELHGRAAARVFLLHGYWPETDALVKELLDREFTPVRELGFACEAMGSYFRYVSAYSCEGAQGFSERR